MKQIRFLLIIFIFLAFIPAGLRAEEVLSWMDCVKEAAKNHPDLIAAQEVVKQSQAAKGVTASALYPQIDSSLSASTAKNAGAAGSSTADSYQYGLTGTQLIFDAGKTMSGVRAATENIAASKQSFKFTSATVRFRLRSAFVDLLKAQEALKITKDIFDIRKQNYELISLRYYSGLEHKGALLTAEASLAQAKYGIAQAERELVVARREMVKEMGRANMAPLAAKGDFVVRVAVDDKPDLQAIAGKNPSLLQLIAQKNAAEFNLKAAYASFSPALNGQAGISKGGTHWPPKGDEYDLGLTLSMPVFEGGLRTSQVAQARATLNQLKENERSTRDALILKLQQTWSALQNAVDNVKVKNKSLQANTERSKIAQLQYSTGFVTFDNWTIIEDNLVQAKQDNLNALAAALLAEANWIQAKGETLEYE